MAKKTLFQLKQLGHASQCLISVLALAHSITPIQTFLSFQTKHLSLADEIFSPIFSSDNLFPLFKID